MRWIISVIITLGLLVTLAAYGPGALQAEKFNPAPPDPALDALFTNMAEPVLRESGLIGAEDLEPGPDGRLYASLADGRIMARSPDGEWSEAGDTGGRPLGLAFGPGGRLFVADALRGLLVQEEGGWRTLLPAGPYPDLVFADDLTVLDDGSVILTDASARYGYGEYMMSYLEGEQGARVLRVHPDGRSETVMDGLAFANGVTHDPETGLVYINETWAGRVWTFDPETGEGRVFLDGLPGYPDNLHWDADEGLLWIALPSRRAEDIESLHPHPFVKRLVWRVIQVFGLPPLPPRPVMALAVDASGAPVHALYGPDDSAYGATTAVPWEGRVWVGGLERESVDAFETPRRLPQSPPRRLQ